MVGLCRCCASLKKPDLLVTIQNESDEICQKLEKCCQLFIRVRDSLPKVVCHECLECLDNSYKFYVKVNEAQETLEAFYPQTLPKDDIEVPVQIDANISEKSLVESTSLEKEELKDQEATSEEKCPRLKSDAALDNAQKSIEHSFILIDNTDLSENVLGHEKEIPVVNVDGNEKVTKAVAIAPREEGRSQKRKNCPTKRLLYKKIQKRTNKAAVSTSKLLETHPFSNEDNKYLEEVYTLLGMTKDDISDESAQVLAREVVEVHGDKEEVRVEKQHKNNDVERYILTAEGVFEKEHSDKDIKFQKNAAEKELTEQPTNEALRIISVEEVSDHLTNEKDILKEASLDPPPHPHVSQWKSYKYYCYACIYTGTSIPDLFEHAKSKHNVEHFVQLQYKCFDCQNIFIHYSSFLNHIRLRHHPALKLRCDACDILCKTFQEYENHRKNACNQALLYPEVLPCKFCCKNFHTSCGLQTHFKQAHTMAAEEAGAKIFKCQQCNKTFSWEKGLKNHEITHARKETFSCKYCDKMFLSKSNLEAHITTHTAERLFQCHICYKSFKTGVILQKHQMIHTDIKPFKCTFCPKDFRTKIQQTTHERTHTGEAPLQCTHCDKSFRFRSALRAHLKVHSGVREYACDYCPKTFNDLSNFKKHMKRKHFDVKEI